MNGKRRGGLPMKLISWNVNGLRACVGKNFMDFFEKADADVMAHCTVASSRVPI